ncbi:alpha-ketoglutarate-dependent dioxygenase AlkB [Sphingomonas ginsenosidivorax]|uniref:Alpha-ketoglutarate-dependent dioxygenase AlkB n=1 Tax=Sphingomonas ginsenosidivorax TaxID=862135 RepID=A0A5C6UEZ1_9SPHN|nr:alpha-ketoglutarate-dependent dioxygenase AlkB [Sphingomonas ginsenosidivorax]TXC70791.1 alpha-ketoglutarate-dependent dioxygenase AlkB [Sphingomonas ginsenosidivorax]
MQPDLFGPAPVPLVATRADLIDAAEEAELIAAIDATGPTPFRFQGWLGKRLTTSFGWSYDFDRGTMARGLPIPAFLLPVRDRAAAFARVAPDALEQALLIRYDPGAGIGWHRDRPQFEHVVGISLGAPATLRLRRRTDAGFERRALPLVPREAYHLTGEARHDWEHSVAPIDAPRWSITFRSLSDRGRAVAAKASSSE